MDFRNGLMCPGVLLILFGKNGVRPLPLVAPESFKPRIRLIDRKLSVCEGVHDELDVEWIDRAVRFGAHVIILIKAYLRRIDEKPDDFSKMFNEEP